jgi:acetolactate decarboxylase
MENRLMLLAFFILFQAGGLLAQSFVKPKTKAHLFQYGVANAFIDGLYEGQLAMDQLLQQGNFGIGAPNRIDGELTIIDGKAYQSRANGETFEAPKTLMTPFAFVTTFRADTVATLTAIHDLKELFAQIESLLPNPNAIYAVRIKGLFSTVRTRAFPAVDRPPFKPLAQLLDQQQFFDWSATEGDMVGFYIPGYLSGLNIVGLHFHFLSKNRKSGGHVVQVQAKELVIAIEQVQEFRLLPLDSKDFSQFKFDGQNSPNLQKIEKGNR